MSNVEKLIELERQTSLKIWLIQRNITQSEIARDLKIDPTRISKFVTGVQRLSDGQLVDLSNYLGLSVEDLLLKFENERGQIMNLNKLAKLICEREGLKQQVNIAQVKEILRVIVDIEKDACMVLEQLPVEQEAFPSFLIHTAAMAKLFPVKKKAKKR